MDTPSPVKPKNLRRRLAVAGALVTTAALALTGCAAGAASPTDAASATSELRIAVPSYPGSWDQDFVAFDPVALALFKNVYPYLVDYGVTDVDGGQILDTENILPAWAESFTSDDGKLWTLKLRDGATFPSGNPITADDVKWSKDRAFAAKANVAGVYSLIGLTDPEQIQVVDDKTVTFDQAYPSALSAQIQAISLFIYDSKLMKEHATADDPWAQDWAAQNPSDGGLYNVESFTPGQEIVLKANKDYPAEDGPHTDTIRLTVVSDPAAESVLLQNGDVDIALGLGRQQIADLDGVSGVKIISAPSNEMISIPLNTTMAPFDNPLVRQAVAYAMPYDDIISTVYGGDARRPMSIVPIDMPGYTEEGFPYEQDLDKAKDLLSQAGVSGASVELAYAADNDEQEQIAILVQDALGKAGITVTPTPLDPATLGDRRDAKDLAMQITSGQQWVNDVEYLMNGWTTGAYLNYANYSNPTVDADVEASHTITDTDERNALWAEVQEQFATDVPVIPLAQPNYNLPVGDNVKGFVQPVDGLIRLKYLSID
ncbi:ABC transporter substrate-binding protein [Herbiconiux daphne]|uniref:ABC transporter substrate-binding protein n=1 Tax=Herbiconiux daphne TaxID=2970914 RepID=A0ABT2H3C1_9MICO|nr:ABC transporter substrate-binding protein [Herbiconiux daphne]MCS5734422.1 ABC transporter substrate-binding protein [Herbiconiux daphne]